MAHNLEEIRNLLGKFANSFDKKDWSGLKTVLSENIECDYTSLRGIKEKVSAEEFIKKRILALNHIDTHHIIANYEIEVSDENALCKASTIIWRHRDGKEFNTHAIYTFNLLLENSNWKITAIKQDVIWNVGETSIHSDLI